MTEKPCATLLTVSLYATECIDVCSVSVLLHQDVPHAWSAPVPIISSYMCHITTHHAVFKMPPCTEPDPGVTALTVILLVSNDTMLLAEA